MEYHAPKTSCRICGRTFSKRGLSRHIRSCLRKRADAEASGKKRTSFYFLVTPGQGSDYFLHLLLAYDARLEDLDHFLRAIWLECCGHMSAFSYRRWGEEISMAKKIRHVVSPGQTLHYQYDFGSTTELQIKFVDWFQTGTKENARVELLARNAALEVPCDECGEKKATVICQQCQWDDSGWLCEDCSAGHECGEEFLMPFANSPRAGVCGYVGELDNGF